MFINATFENVSLGRSISNCTVLFSIHAGTCLSRRLSLIFLQTILLPSDVIKTLPSLNQYQVYPEFQSTEPEIRCKTKEKGYGRNTQVYQDQTCCFLWHYILSIQVCNNLFLLWVCNNR